MDITFIVSLLLLGLIIGPFRNFYSQSCDERLRSNSRE